jgi:hypothetical protein
VGRSRQPGEYEAPGEPLAAVSGVWPPTERYAYAFNQLIGRELDSDGDGNVDAAQAFVHNGGQIVLYYHDTAAGPLGVADLAHRYLWGPNTDELLADESKGLDDTPGTADDTAWALTDHVGSVRKLVAYNARTKARTAGVISASSSGGIALRCGLADDLVYVVP